MGVLAKRTVFSGKTMCEAEKNAAFQLSILQIETMFGKKIEYNCFWLYEKSENYRENVKKYRRIFIYKSNYYNNYIQITER